MPETNRLRGVIREYWGYDALRPLQAEAMAAILEDRDSLVVLPTGGGKSLCYQAPALMSDGLVVVVSPLISLMHDQVRALVEYGVRAEYVNSSLSPDDQEAVLEAVQAGQVRLLYLAPERLVSRRVMGLLSEVQPAYFVIDEAHCISMWGHDFRPEYRRLSTLKHKFPQTAIHAFTATATQHVRDDIVRELGLKDPAVLVGSFDRPNLVYHFRPRCPGLSAITDVITEHRDESGIIYCIRRREVDELAARLRQQGYRALPYHAGLGAPQRAANQRKFVEDQTDIIVATVAFGMGIDKPDVRYVIHVGMPKSVEHYQQESGRAGRDGLEAHCYLLHDAQGHEMWRRIIGRDDDEGNRIALTKLEDMYRLCREPVCRHRALLAYFGETYTRENCGACDVCLGQTVASETFPAPTREPEHVEEAKPPDYEEMLFERLRRLRRDEARERSVPPYVLFNDATLLQMARLRPTRKALFLAIPGVGKKKYANYGRIFETAIRDFSAEHTLETDVGYAIAQDEEPESPATGARARTSQTGIKEKCWALFEEEARIEEVCNTLGRREKWVLGELEAFVRQTDRVSPYPWVDDVTFEHVREIVEQVGDSRIRTIQNRLGPDTSEADVRLSLVCLRNEAQRQN